MRGRVLDLRPRADLQQVPGVHHRDPVGQLEQQRQVVGDEQDREPELVLQLDDLAEDVALHHDVERGRRLVHDDDLGVDRQRHRDHHPLAHAAGQLVRVAAQPRARDADQVEQRADLLERVLAAAIRRCAWIDVEDLVADVEHRVERVHRALEDDRDLAPAQPLQVGGAQPGDVDRLADAPPR